MEPISERIANVIGKLIRRRFCLALQSIGRAVEAAGFAVVEAGAWLWSRGVFWGDDGR